ncbi:hypothetical protein [Breoghania sp.]|uniref:hypothetical protein n=1 Tax=Breoghania sp. TaxID=2065378 RepID=UPI002AA85C2E|nr:hypothetical protein [Breoghania sp.]
MGDFNEFHREDGRPTDAERCLIGAAGSGEISDCSDFPEVERIISPGLLRAVTTDDFQHSDYPDWRLAPEGVQLIGEIFEEPVYLANRRIPAPLILEFCAFKRGVNLTNTRIEGPIRFDHSTFNGEVLIDATVVTGQVSANNTAFLNAGGRALSAQGIKAAGWFMHNAKVEGEFAINSSEIAGQFASRNAIFCNPAGRAIRAQGIKATSWFMHVATVEGEFAINGAEISGQFGAEDATFCNPTGIALRGSFSRFLGGILIRGNTRIDGEIRLDRATVKTGFQLTGLTLSPSLDRCLTLANANIEAPVQFFNTTFLGAIDTRRTRFRSAANFRSAALICSAQARKQGLIVAEALEQSEALRMPSYCLLLQEAVFEGRLIMPRVCPQGIVDLSRARCDTLEDFESGWPPNLEPGQDVCNDRLCDTESGRDIQHIVLDGFECRHFEHPSGTIRPSGDHVGEARVRWLAGQSAADLKGHFNPQPWRMTSAVLRAMGYDKAADKVSIERRTRQRRADGIPLRSRIMGFLLHHAADYGYNPVKATLWCATLVVAFSLVFWALEAACSNGACGPERLFQQVREGDIENTPYPTFQPLLYSLDLFVPILDFGSDTLWRADVTASPPFKKPLVSIGWQPWNFIHSIPVGWFAHILAIFERVVGAIMVAITIIGFTGLVKREEK